MSTSHTAFVFRLYPNLKQQRWLSYVFRANKVIWNDLLHQEKERSDNREPATPVRLLIAQARNYIRRDGFTQGDPNSYGEVAALLYKALEQNRRNPKFFGYPNFKKESCLPYSYIVRNDGNSVTYDGEFLRVPYLGKLKIRGLRPLPFGAEILSVFIKHKVSGRYYATILFRRHLPKPKLDPVIANKAIGLDYSPSRLFVSSDPEFQLSKDILTAHRKDMKRISERNHRLQRSKRGSKRYELKRLSLCKLEEHVANRRKDTVEKVTDLVTKKYGIICIETLDIKRMQSRKSVYHLGKSVANSSWGTFTNRLSQKCEERGNVLIKVPKLFPSTKRCSRCGSIKDMPLNERTYNCPKCGLRIDRDYNAAINIRAEGLRMLAK